ncbi:MAG: hypothetical protein SVQ76_00900 [Candidatus Nanohaloarchaea archaeon]|nr:hypothetical protein [Candidatus Nanohaloarchaea archaeon]
MEARIDEISFGMSFGAVVGLFLFSAGLLSWAVGWGGEYVDVAASFMVGYGPHPLGSILGGLEGAIPGFVMGWLVARFYNTFERRRA